MRAVAHTGAALLAFGGTGFVALYVLIATGTLSTDSEIREVGLLAGVGVSSSIPGGAVC